MIERVTVEKIDTESKFVSKRVVARTGIFLGRQMPINNSLYYGERIRKALNKPLLWSPFQVSHIHADRTTNFWMYNSIPQIRQHAKENQRVFFPYQQRTKKQMIALSWHISEEDTLELINLGIQYVPFVFPENASFEEVLQKLEWIKSKLQGAQEIIPVLSTNHEITSFKVILKHLFGKYKMIGMHFLSPESNARAKVNLLDLWEINASIQEGSDTSLVIGFNVKKHYSGMKVSGSFVAARYGIDIPSPIQMHPDQVRGMMYGKTLAEVETADDYFVYDQNEGGFNKAEEQIIWYEENRTMRLLSEINLSEGFDVVKAIAWSNFCGQQEDFNLLNRAILEKEEVNKLISSKSRWVSYTVVSANTNAE